MHTYLRSELFVKHAPPLEICPPHFAIRPLAPVCPISVFQYFSVSVFRLPSPHHPNLHSPPSSQNFQFPLFGFPLFSLPPPRNQAPKSSFAMAIKAAICPIQKRNIHLMISALMSAPSCLVIRRLVRSSSCSRNASSKLSAMARALGGSIWAASRIERILVVLTNVKITSGLSHCQTAPVSPISVFQCFSISFSHTSNSALRHSPPTTKQTASPSRCVFKTSIQGVWRRDCLAMPCQTRSRAFAEMKRLRRLKEVGDSESKIALRLSMPPANQGRDK